MSKINGAAQQKISVIETVLTESVCPHKYSQNVAIYAETITYCIESWFCCWIELAVDAICPQLDTCDGSGPNKLFQDSTF